MCETRSQTKLRQIKSELQLNQLKNNSFERFGDDLCELVLSYLSVKEKLVFQRVSKQWQTLVFNKQKVLIIDEEFGFNSLDLVKYSVKYLNQQIVSHKILKNVLKKFRFVNELKFKCFIDGKVLQIIANNCQHLKKISFNDLKNTSEKVLISFGNKSGHKLQFVKQYYGEMDSLKTLLPFTPNVKSVDFYSHYSGEYLSELFLKENFFNKLENVSINNCDLETFKSFTDKYYNNIKTMDFYLYFYSSDKQFDTYLKPIIRYSNLEALHLEINDVKDMDNVFISISKNCHKIKDFRLQSDDEIEFKRSVFQLMAEFKSLKKLSIRLPYVKCAKNGSIASFAKFTELYDLELYLSDLNDSHLENIDSFLPNLKRLLAVSEDLITDKTVKYISRMKRLTRLMIENNSENIVTLAITEDSINAILDNHINTRKRVFHIYPLLNITKDLSIIHKTISMAKTYHKTKYFLKFYSLENNTKYNFYYSKDTNNCSNNVSKIRGKVNYELPPNLKIITDSYDSSFDSDISDFDDLDSD